MNGKKILAILLAAVLLCSVFAGCAPKEAPDAGGQTDDGGVSEPSREPAPARRMNPELRTTAGQSLPCLAR